MHKDIIKWKKLYGNIFTLWMPDPYIIVNDYEALKEYFIKQGEIFAGRPNLNVMADFLGGQYGLIINDNSWYKNQRHFALHVLRDFGLGRPILQNTIIDQANKMVQLLEETKGAPVDLIPYFTSSIGNVIFQLVFGYVREHTDPELHMFKANLDGVVQSFNSPIAFLIELSFKFKMLDRIFGGAYMKGLEKNEEILEFLRKEVDQHRKR
uniref:Cytochrome P450 n=1 Tax=Acrobeloides nanus TaxID=290746 RepID=A0A914CIU7_9BILA